MILDAAERVSVCNALTIRLLLTDIAPNGRRIVQIIRPHNGVHEEYQAGDTGPNHIGTSA